MAFSRRCVPFLVLLCLPACGLIDKLKGKSADAGGDAEVDAAVAIEVPDAAPVADAAVVATATPTASPPIVGACKPGDLADCTAKCEKQKNQSSCVNLGLMFASGEGVAKDNNKAATLFQGACNGNVGAGCERFGVALHNGLGIQARSSPRRGHLQEGLRPQERLRVQPARADERPRGGRTEGHREGRRGFPEVMRPRRRLRLRQPRQPPRERRRNREGPGARSRAPQVGMRQGGPAGVPSARGG